VIPVDSSPQVAREFDLSGLQGKLNKTKRSSRRVLSGVSILLAALVAAFVLADLPDLERGTLSLLRWGTLIAFVGFCGVMIAWTVPSIAARVDGAVRLRISESGFSLHYPNGRAQEVRWSDPKLTFQLYNWAVNSPRRVEFTTPFDIVLNRAQSTISLEAFEALQTAAKQQGLHETTVLGSPWVYSSGVRPSIVTFKGGSPAR